MRQLDAENQLDRANADFEEFISMAAHNLRESLRDITAYSEILAETSSASPDSEAATCLHRIQEGAARAQALLTGVVDYWAADPVHQDASEIDMNAVLTQALLSTASRIDAAGAIVTHDPLPRVLGDFKTLSLVVHHLLRNAIDYAGDDVPRIHVSSTCEGGVCTFSVRDNGSGVEAEFQSRIFGVFKRLHGKEHPGNGLGLAFCKKAIERHGGHIWIASAARAGSTFYFTLPASL